MRDSFPEAMSLRVHRAISWIGRAEDSGDDDDARFIFLWIAFNAAYADERTFQDAQQNERSSFQDYFAHLIALDTKKRIYNALWQRFAGPVRLLMANRYIYSPFWLHHNGINGFQDWETRFRVSGRFFNESFQAGNASHVLSAVFDRLYVLRNQLVHGGATWSSRVNRNQVRDGAAILSFLLPVFVDLMMDHPFEYWGQPFYPVVTE